MSSLTSLFSSNCGKHDKMQLFTEFKKILWTGFRAILDQPRSQGLFPRLRAGREKTLASAGHVPTLHPEILGVIN